MNDTNESEADAKGHDQSAKSQVCARCVKILPDRIFTRGKSRRQKRYLIGRAADRKSGSQCPMCIFLDQLDRLAAEALNRPHTEVSLSTGAVQAAFSTFDTERPWWHVLGLETSRPTPDYVWYESLSSTNPSKASTPRIVVAWVPSATRDQVSTWSSIPSKQSAREQEGFIDLHVAKSWLDICERDHRDACFFESTRVALKIRLIDVDSRVIVDADTDLPYVALSYVWGNRTKARHGRIPNTPSSSGLGDPSEASQARQLPANLPATLEDAITIVKGLGEQYLWIDLFCIDQSNVHEVETQINQMNMIYQSATFTIFARDGEDAHTGIAGISRPMRLRAQPNCSLQGGELIATALRPAVANAGKSPWDTRAWTMQEWLFSYRCLSFTDYNVRLICNEYFLDNIVADGGDDRHPVNLISRDDWDDVVSINLRVNEWDFRLFSSLISLYTARLLSYPDDILNACQGALTELEARTGETFRFSIPLGDIHRALLWSPHCQHTLTRRPGFPSWSWCGWFGRIEYRRWIQDLHDLGDLRERGELTIVKKKTKRRKGGKARDTIATVPVKVADVSFPSPTTLRIRSWVASGTLQKRRDDRKESTLLTVTDDEVGTVVKKDLGYHWTVVDRLGRPMTDVANNAGEPDTFDETNHFLRLSQEDSDMLDRRGGKVELLQIHQLPLVRDSDEHDWYLEDMVSCLVIVRNDDETACRIGAVLFEREVFDGLKPKMIDIDII